MTPLQKFNVINYELMLTNISIITPTTAFHWIRLLNPGCSGTFIEMNTEVFLIYFVRFVILAGKTLKKSQTFHFNALNVCVVLVACQLIGGIRHMRPLRKTCVAPVITSIVNACTMSLYISTLKKSA